MVVKSLWILKNILPIQGIRKQQFIDYKLYYIKPFEPLTGIMLIILIIWLKVLGYQFQCVRKTKTVPPLRATLIEFGHSSVHKKTLYEHL